MRHLIPFRSVLRTISWAIFGAFVFTCAMAMGAQAQHAGAHAGGAGHVSSPPASHPAGARPIAPIRPPVVSPAPRSFLVRPPVSPIVSPARFRFGYPFPRRPISPRRPIFPIVPPPRFGFGVFGVPFFGWGFGWGFNPGLWPGCNPFWGWGYGCNGLAAFEYEPGINASPAVPFAPQPQMQVEYAPPYFYGEANSQYVQLYLDDGTVYNVTDYWLVNGELHFKIVEDHGTKVAEHTIEFDRLDLQKTIDVNTDRGFRFVLRNEPIEKYLIDHPSSEAPDEAPAEPEPAEP